MSSNTNVKRKGTRRQTMIYRKLHRQFRIEQHKPH